MLKFATSRQRTRAIHFAAAAASAVLLGGVYASAQTQLLLDPGFEAGVSGAPNAAPNDVPMSTAGPWIGWNNWVPPYSGYYTQSIAAHSGTQVGKTFSSLNGGIYQYAPVTAGEAYTASAWFVNSSSDALQAGETDDV